MARQDWGKTLDRTCKGEIHCIIDTRVGKRDHLVEPRLRYLDFRSPVTIVEVHPGCDDEVIESRIFGNAANERFEFSEVSPRSCEEQDLLHEEISSQDN